MNGILIVYFFSWFENFAPKFSQRKHAIVHVIKASHVVSTKSIGE